MNNYVVTFILENEESYFIETQGINEDQVLSNFYSQGTELIKINPYDNVIVYINFNKVLKIQIQQSVE